MSGLEVRVERLVDASPEDAFRHWTDAEARMRWHRTDDDWEVEATTDLRVGGAWRVAWGPSSGERYVEEGVFLVVHPPHQVVCTCVHRVPGRPVFETRLTVLFEPRGEQTLVTLLESDFPDEETRRTYESGWPAFLDTFGRTLADP